MLYLIRQKQSCTSRKTWLRNLAIDMRRAAKTGQRYELPPLAELPALPEFDALRQFLAQRGVDVAVLQAAIDEWVEVARRQVTENG